jgi:hypothetical protein
MSHHRGMTDDRDVDSAPTPTRTRSWTTAGIGDAAFAALADGLAASELWSLLLDVFARRAGRRSPASVLQQWERDGFTRPAPIDQRTFVALDGHLLAAADAHGFASIELSPLAPLGACSVVGLGSQHRIVSALRGTEVVADPTNLLALECARRLRAGATSDTPQPVVRLATCHRCVRAQKVPNIPHFAQHFRIFCLASAGHERKDHQFVTTALIEQIETQLAALDRLEAHGYAFADRRVKVLATDARAALGDRVADALRRQNPHVPVTREPLEHAYYDGGLRFMISTRAPNGQDYPLIDGGAFNWLGRLTSNQKLVFVASGMGAQLAAAAFRARPR